jgi:hypothetical protein
MGWTSIWEYTTKYQIIFSGHHVVEWRRINPLYPLAFPGRWFDNYGVGGGVPVGRMSISAI